MTDELQDLRDRVEKLEHTVQQLSVEAGRSVPVTMNQDNRVSNSPAWKPRTGQLQAQEIQKKPVSGPPQKVQKSAKELEMQISLYLSRIGMIGLLLGLAFLLKYAFDNNIIGPLGRILIGYASGIAFFLFGEYYRKTYTQWSRVFTGGALVILYLSTFSAQYFYDFYSLTVTVALLSVITGCGVAIAAAYRSPSVFTFALLGGYLTPLVISSHAAEEALLRLAYILLLNIGVVAITRLMEWRVFDMFALVGTALYMAVLYSDVSMWTAIAFTTMLYAIFSFSTWSLATQESHTRKGDFLYVPSSAIGLYVVGHALFLYLFLVLPIDAQYEMYTGFVGVAMALLYAGVAFVLQQDSHVAVHTRRAALAVSILSGIAGVFTLHTTQGEIEAGMASALLAALYLALAVFVHSKKHSLMEFYSVATAAGIAFLAASIGILVDAQWLSMVWALLAIGVVQAGSQMNDDKIRTNGLFVLGLALLGMIPIFQEYAYGRVYGEGGLMFFNATFIPALITVVSVAVCGKLYSSKNEDRGGQKDIAVLLTMAFSAFFISLVTAELTTWIQSAQVERVAITTFLALYAITATAIGLLLHSAVARQTGLVVFAFAVGKAVLVDLATLELIYRVLAFITLGVILILASYLYQRKVKSDTVV